MHQCVRRKLADDQLEVVHEMAEMVVSQMNGDEDASTGNAARVVREVLSACDHCASLPLPSRLRACRARSGRDIKSLNRLPAIGSTEPRSFRLS